MTSTISINSSNRSACRSRSIRAGASELYGYGGITSINANRLTSFQLGTLSSDDTSITGTPTTSESWSYDALGNQLSETINGTTDSNTLNSQNQLTGFNSSGANQTFDNNGNTLNGSDGTIYTYDAWNHMATATVGSVTGGYSYDALGRRIRITDSTGGTETLIYSADGQLIESDADEVWITGSVVAAGESISIQSQYVWGLNGPNDLVLRDDNSTAGNLGTDAAPYLGVRIYSINDANHDVMALSDASTGAVFQWFGYDPYGKQYVFDSAHASTTAGTYFDIGFQGGIIDGLTGLVHFEARDMNPVTGRWMTGEPFGSAYVGGANLYQPFDSNPVAETDPDGADPQAVVLVNPVVFGKGTDNAVSAGLVWGIRGLDTRSKNYALVTVENVFVVYSDGTSKEIDHTIFIDPILATTPFSRDRKDVRNPFVNPEDPAGTYAVKKGDISDTQTTNEPCPDDKKAVKVIIK